MRSLCRQQLGRARSQWQSHDKRAANSIRIVPRHDFSAVRANNSVANAQPQPCALAYFFRREKRIEDPVRMRDARPVVAKADLQLPIPICRLDLDFSVPLPFLNGVVSVIQNVQEHLLQLVRIPQNLRQILAILFGEFHAVV